MDFCCTEHLWCLAMTIASTIGYVRLFRTESFRGWIETYCRDFLLLASRGVSFFFIYRGYATSNARCSSEARDLNKRKKNEITKEEEAKARNDSSFGGNAVIKIYLWKRFFSNRKRNELNCGLTLHLYIARGKLFFFSFLCSFHEVPDSYYS